MLKNKLGKFTSSIFHFITSIRYKIKVDNIELLKDEEGLLLLPNHPALIDPIILTGIIGRYILFSPVISKDYSKLPILSSIFFYFGAEYIDTQGSNEKLQENIFCLKNKLLQNENILLYPAGSIYSKGTESISNKRMAHLMMKEGTHKKVIGIRIDGLWGSMWSKALTGDAPDIGKNLLLGLYYAIVNAIFFVPKREVKISFHDITKDVEQWSSGDKTSFNKNLEDFYNNYPAQEKYIPHYFYYDDSQKIIANRSLGIQPENDVFNTNTEESLSHNVFSDLKEIIETIKHREISKLEWGTNLIIDLGMDSLDMMELKILIQRRFPTASNPEIQSLKTLRDIGKMALGESIQVSTHGPAGSLSRLVLLRGFLSTFSGDKIGILLDKIEGEKLMLALSSLRKTGIPIVLTGNEDDFYKAFEMLDSEMIITTRSRVNSIRSPWFAKYEHNIIFMEDIVSRKSSMEYLGLLTRGLLPPYGSRK